MSAEQKHVHEGLSGHVGALTLLHETFERRIHVMVFTDGIERIDVDATTESSMSNVQIDFC